MFYPLGYKGDNVDVSMVRAAICLTSKMGFCLPKSMKIFTSNKFSRQKFSGKVRGSLLFG